MGEPALALPSDISERARELVDELREALLPGPRTRVTTEVRAWGMERTPALTDEELLERYNEAVETGVARARQMLAETARDRAGRRAVIATLNHGGTGDQARTLALEALIDVIQPEDVEAFATVSVNQRAAVVPLTLDVLQKVATAEAAFAMRRVFGELANGIGQNARTRAASIRDELMPLRTLSENHESSRDLVFSALVLEPEDQAGLRKLSAEPRAQLRDAVVQLDEDLVSSGRTAAGLSGYESLVRIEAHALVLLAELADRGLEVGLGKRAMDTTFGRPPEEFQMLSGLLGREAIEVYFSRAVTPANVRKAPARAQAAIRAPARRARA